MGARGLEVVKVIGVVAIAAGLGSVVLGAASVPGGGEPTASLDNELRFYAAWYVVAGALALRASSRVESEAFLVRAIAVGFLLAACGRVIGIVTVGSPHAVAWVLMAVEFVLPAVLVPWQAAVARRSGGAGVDAVAGRATGEDATR